MSRLVRPLIDDPQQGIPQVPIRFPGLGLGTNMAQLIFPGFRFKLVYVRVHFSLNYGQSAPGSPTLNSLTIHLMSGLGDEYDTKLHTEASRGYNADANIEFGADDTRDPSPWAFASDDGLLFQWTNTDLIRWGLIAGIAPF